MGKAVHVGARELKTRLPSYLRQVRGGDTIVVTDHGKPIAELRPIVPESLPPWLARLVAAGIVTPGTGKPLRPIRPIRLKGGASLSDASIEDREDRF